MSMMGEFRELSEFLLARIRSKPALIESVVFAHLLPGATTSASPSDAVLQSMPLQQGDAMSAMRAAMSPEQRAAMEARAVKAAANLRDFGAAIRSRAGGEVIPPEQLGERFSIQKAWHGVHYLICGTAEDAPGILGQAVA